MRTLRDTDFRWESIFARNCARPGGGINFFPISYLSTGYDYPQELARILSGEDPLLSINDEVYHLGWHFFNTPQGVLSSVDGFNELRNNNAVVDAKLYVKVGEPRPNRSDDLARPGYVLVKAKSHAEVKRNSMK